MEGAFFKLLAFALIPVTAAGCCLFAMLSPPSFLERATASYLSIGGLVGSIAAGIVVLSLRRRVSSWHVLGLGRNTLISLVGIAWLLGAAGGVLIFYVIPR